MHFKVERSKLSFKFKAMIMEVSWCLPYVGVIMGRLRRGCCVGKAARGGARHTCILPKPLIGLCGASLGRTLGACRGARLSCISCPSELGVSAIISATAS